MKLLIWEGETSLFSDLKNVFDNCCFFNYTFLMNNTFVLRPRHGSPADRGSADAYYNRAANPHYFVGSTYQSQMIPMECMTVNEINAYMAAYNNESVRRSDFLGSVGWF